MTWPKEIAFPATSGVALGQGAYGLWTLSATDKAREALILSPPFAALRDRDPTALRDFTDVTMAKAIAEAGLGTGLELLPLPTPSDHNCLCHAVAMSLWGSQDKDRSLRGGIAKSMEGDGAAAKFFKEQWMRMILERDRSSFGMDIERSVTEWVREWREELQLVKEGARSLTEIHVFVLAHVIRRPIIVYCARVCRGTDGQALAPVYFGGIYLPILLAPEDCASTHPVLLAYGQSHFTPLVPMERAPADGTAATAGVGTLAAPLCDGEGELLPVQFVDQALFTPGSTIWKALIKKYLRVADESPPTVQLGGPSVVRCPFEAVLLSHSRAICASRSVEAARPTPSPPSPPEDQPPPLPAASPTLGLARVATQRPESTLRSYVSQTVSYPTPHRTRCASPPLTASVGDSALNRARSMYVPRSKSPALGLRPPQLRPAAPSAGGLSPRTGTGNPRSPPTAAPLKTLPLRATPHVLSAAERWTSQPTHQELGANTMRRAFSLQNPLPSNSGVDTSSNSHGQKPASKGLDAIPPLSGLGPSAGVAATSATTATFAADRGTRKPVLPPRPHWSASTPDPPTGPPRSASPLPATTPRTERPVSRSQRFLSSSSPPLARPGSPKAATAAAASRDWPTAQPVAAGKADLPALPPVAAYPPSLKLRPAADARPAAAAAGASDAAAPPHRSHGEYALRNSSPATRRPGGGGISPRRQHPALSHPLVSISPIRRPLPSALPVRLPAR